ncbi:MAG: hypothetical protein LBM78_04970 [Clostridiales bacterium]|jgi:hypothetical protein|nr:hypothetical protein [Clostridiales bacterium]
MDFLKDIAVLAGLPVGEALGGYRVTLLSDGACYVAGHKGVATFEGSSILFKLSGRLLALEGAGLTLHMLSGEDAVVKGDIRAVRLT